MPVHVGSLPEVTKLWSKAPKLGVGGYKSHIRITDTAVRENSLSAEMETMSVIKALPVSVGLTW